MYICRLFTPTTDRTGKRAEHKWILRDLSTHEARGECMRLAAFEIQKYGLQGWEDQMKNILCGSEEYLCDCLRKLSARTHRISWGELVPVKSGPHI